MSFQFCAEVASHQWVGKSGFGDSDTYNLYAGVPVIAASLELVLEALIEGVKFSDVNFIECMFGAELIYLVVYFIKYESLIIIKGVFFNRLDSVLFFQSIDDFYFVEIDYDSGGCPAGDIGDLIRLECDLNLRNLCQKWDHPIQARLRILFLFHTSHWINSDMSFFHYM